MSPGGNGHQRVGPGDLTNSILGTVLGESLTHLINSDVAAFNGYVIDDGYP